MRVDYTKADFVSALKAAGVERGGAIFSHGNIGYFGLPEGAHTGPQVCQLILDAFLEVLGREGTLIVPTFTYSFGTDKPDKTFDVANTPSTCGMFTEHVRTRAGSRRSSDPMFSVAALGAKAEHFTAGTSIECFGEDSFWRKFLDSAGMICNLNFDAGSTFVHFVERRLGVPYRSNRSFRGTIVENGVSRPAEAVFYCRDLGDVGAEARFERFDSLAREAGYVRTAKVGRGVLVGIDASDVVRLVETNLPREPRFLTKAGA